MQALTVSADRELRVTSVADPGAPPPGCVSIRISYCAINRLDLYAWRGMPFARQPLPLILGAEAAGIVDEVGSGVSGLSVGDPVVIYPGVLCGHCSRCGGGEENLCESPAGVRGFHLSGFACERVVSESKYIFKVPHSVPLTAAACAPVTLATVHHMLCDNARLREGETILIQAGASGVGSAAIRLAKYLGAHVIATVGSEAKMVKAYEYGADLVINYSRESFVRVVRRETAKRGVDVVFEHVGATTWQRSLTCLARGGRLVICGSHTGSYAQTNLLQLFNNQLRIFASFGSRFENLRRVLDLLSVSDVRVPIESMIGFNDSPSALGKLESRLLAGKTVIDCRRAI